MEGYGNPSGRGCGGFAYGSISGDVGIVREDPGRCGRSGYRGAEKISGTASVSGAADGIYPAVCRLSVRWDPGWRGCLYQYRQ